jgi:hypothetical protein
MMIASMMKFPIKIPSRLIQTLKENAQETAGVHQIEWSPAKLASGTYIVRVEIPGKVAGTVKLVKK